MNFQASVNEQASSSLSFNSFSINSLLTSGSEASPKCSNFLYPVIFQLDLIRSIEMFLNMSQTCFTASSSFGFSSYSIRPAKLCSVLS